MLAGVGIDLDPGHFKSFGKLCDAESILQFRIEPQSQQAHLYTDPQATGQTEFFQIILDGLVTGRKAQHRTGHHVWGQKRQRHPVAHIDRNLQQGHVEPFLNRWIRKIFPKSPVQRSGVHVTQSGANGHRSQRQIEPDGHVPALAVVERGPGITGFDVTELVEVEPQRNAQLRLRGGR